MPQSPIIDDCIAACIQCSIECDNCAEASSRMTSMGDCVQACRKCSDTCRFCVDALQVGSYADCDECAEACDSCATICDRYDDEHCRKCAEACRKCDAACRAVIDQLNLYGALDSVPERLARETAGPGGL